MISHQPCVVTAYLASIVHGVTGYPSRIFKNTYFKCVSSYHTDLSTPFRTPNTSKFGTDAFYREVRIPWSHTTVRVDKCLHTQMAHRCGTRRCRFITGLRHPIPLPRLHLLGEKYRRAGVPFLGRGARPRRGIPGKNVLLDHAFHVLLLQLSLLSEERSETKVGYMRRKSIADRIGFMQTRLGWHFWLIKIL